VHTNAVQRRKARSKEEKQKKRERKRERGNGKEREDRALPPKSPLPTHTSETEGRRRGGRLHR
jgi:hypothetical protein